ncbi:hypothetical protein AB0J28_23680 [Streptosporangium canum]|uniref:hypothetical protein n=1 Tax=Streptosporangium canum TaxID=324952 RepID=UPI00344824C9
MPTFKANAGTDNTEHRHVRIEHTFTPIKNYKILRDCRQKGASLHHTVHVVTYMYNLALTA